MTDYLNTLTGSAGFELGLIAAFGICVIHNMLRSNK
jgi:hypothetical protein